MNASSKILLLDSAFDNCRVDITVTENLISLISAIRSKFIEIPISRRFGFKTFHRPYKWTRELLTEP